MYIKSSIIINVLYSYKILIIGKAEQGALSRVYGNVVCSLQFFYKPTAAQKIKLPVYKNTIL